jgi:hypothetical protein
MNHPTAIDVPKLLDLALHHMEEMDWKQAAKVLGEVLAADSDNPDALHLMGVTAHRVGLSESAVGLIERAIRLKPREPRYHSNCGEIYRRMGKLDLAIAHLRQSLSLDPRYSMAHGNLGSALLDQGKIIPAINSFRAAIRLDPNNPEAHWNLSLALLLTGNFEEGWREYDWRWEASQKQAKRTYPQPQWDGSDLSGRTILLYSEQGLGDALQFIRYVPLVAARGGRVVVECRPELKRLLESMPGIVLTATGESLPQFDVHLPILSLPRVFGTTLENIPAQVPYLSPAPDLVRRWQERAGFGRDRLNIGLAWAGNRSHVNDRNRSIPFDTFLPLLDVPGVAFYSLQKGDGAEASPGRQMNPSVVDLTGDLVDFEDTAALVSHLDLLISVDTAVAHLAGALAKPVWTLLPYVPDWRWMLERDDSPWYPTMRLFRQTTPGDWASVIRSVAGELADCASRQKDISPSSRRAR